MLIILQPQLTCGLWLVVYLTGTGRINRDCRRKERFWRMLIYLILLYLLNTTLITCYIVSHLISENVKSIQILFNSTVAVGNRTGNAGLLYLVLLWLVLTLFSTAKINMLFVWFIPNLERFKSTILCPLIGNVSFHLLTHTTVELNIVCLFFSSE